MLPGLNKAPPPDSRVQGTDKPAVPRSGKTPTLGRAHRDLTEQSLSRAAMLVDVLVVIVGILFAFWLRVYSGWITFQWGDYYPRRPAEYWWLFLFLSGATFSGLLFCNIYSLDNLRQPGRTIPRITLAAGLGLFAFTGLVTVLRLEPPLPRLVVLFSFGFIVLGACAWRLVLSWILRRPAYSQAHSRRVLVIGSNAHAVRLAQHLRQQAHEYHFAGWLAPNRSAESSGDGCGGQISDSHEELGPALGRLDDLQEIIRRQAIHLVILAEHGADDNDVVFVSTICELEHVDFKLVPRFFEVVVSGLRPGRVGEVAVLGVEALPLGRFEHRVVKRLLDVCGAAVGLILSAPLFLLFGALIYLESPGTILFKQQRIGFRRRPFTMLKLRSMQLGAEAHDHLNQSTTRGDGRLLRIGAFMRKWNLDETPQFWNVLKGDMSLVGPRPERPFHADRLTDEIPHYQVRHLCLPGMTGWAQVKGLRGDSDLVERIRNDIWYVEHWTLWLDLKILALTFIRNDQAY